MSDLFDTCLFIDYWRGDPSAVSLVNSVRNSPKSASFSTISATELWQYPGLGRQEEIEYIALTSFFLQEAPLTAKAAIKAGQCLRSYARNRRMQLVADALIAAVAEERSETVRTRNAKDITLFYQNVQTY
jgi:predicted nucleic acid-binding protein